MSEAHSLIGAWAVDAVDARERALVEAHLADFPSCAEEAGALLEAVARLADTAATEPPPRLRKRVLAAARRTVQDTPPPRDAAPDPVPPVASARLTRAPRVVSTLAAAALGLAITLAGAALTWSQLTPDGPDAQVSAVIDAPDATVASATGANGGTVTVTASIELDQAVITVAELPAIGEDRAYQVWLLEPDGPVSAGIMHPGETSATLVVDDLADATAIALTQEPAGGSNAPTRPAVAHVPIGVPDAP
ncbi:Anti-sigma-K factor rskA [Glycomyces sambucus]|uniref:Regulator of SigK n=1 Tax=Glycomyces sambucus TaxID=380244 RepID=A0A1G9CB68_9ACTN|nr:anti-sigma factor [Glycomyces sambucus]SDK48911.1 Anti-sigma-K factor rskA [Glycomyces sambucus]